MLRLDDLARGLVEAEVFARVAIEVRLDLRPDFVVIPSGSGRGRQPYAQQHRGYQRGKALGRSH